MLFTTRFKMIIPFLFCENIFSNQYKLCLLYLLALQAAALTAAGSLLVLFAPCLPRLVNIICILLVPMFVELQVAPHIINYQGWPLSLSLKLLQFPFPCCCETKQTESSDMTNTLLCKDINTDLWSKKYNNNSPFLWQYYRGLFQSF